LQKRLGTKQLTRRQVNCGIRPYTQLLITSNIPVDWRDLQDETARVFREDGLWLDLA